MSLDRQAFLEANKEPSALQLKRQKRRKRYKKIGKWLVPKQRGS